MANAINYAQKYQRELDQMIQQGLLTSILETPNVDWLNAKSFQVPHLAVTGYKAHSRNGGFNRGDVTVTHDLYTLSFDRDVEFFVDRADIDESNEAASAANVTRIFTSKHASPEIDAYRFSKLATQAITDGDTASAALTTADVYSTLKAAILPIRKYGVNNVVVYVSSEVMDLLERADDFVRNINVQTVGASTLESRVTSIDGIQIIEVWDADRFYTAYNFTTGFIPAANALEINFLVVAKPAVVAKAKLAAVYLFQPGQHTSGDGYLYQNRLYHDLFKLENKADSLFVHTKPAAP